jgi:DNA-directed RNA polymerase subunit RPC12/RpoP
VKETLLLSLFSYRGAGCSTPFSLLDRGAETRRRCGRCGSWITIPDLSNSVLKLDKQKRFLPDYFPDICATGVFHSRVVDELRREECTGFRAYPTHWDGLEEWVEMMTPKADALEWPQYYRIEILGRVALDRSESDPDGKVYCPECGIRLPGIPVDTSKRYRKIPVHGTWDGSDLCVWRGETQGRSPLCSRRFIDLAARYTWTNLALGDPTPGVFFASPIPQNWLELIEPKIRELHPDQFE